MKLIDADKILEALGVFKDKKHGDPHFLAAIATAMEIIEGMPEAVVRCWDCIYWEPATLSSGNCGRALEITAYKDDYCSYGKRRTDDA